MKKKGFTLIELLVVIAIIGLLSTLAVVSLGTARSKARDAKMVSDAKAIQTAMEMVKNDTGGTVTTTNLASYIQGGIPKPKDATSYYLCYNTTATVNKYLVLVKLENTPVAGANGLGTTPSWVTGAHCAPINTDGTIGNQAALPANTDCTSANKGYCVGDN